MQKNELPVIGKDGLYIQHPYGSGLLLARWLLNTIGNRRPFCVRSVVKAGLPPNHILILPALYIVLLQMSLAKQIHFD